MAGERWRCLKIAWLCCLAAMLGGLGCGEPSSTADRIPTRPTTLAGNQVLAGPLVVTHGGVGSSPDLSPPCYRAAQHSLSEMDRGASALAAAVEGTKILENDPRFNAGTGANIRLDGRTIQMDAAAMASDGRFGAVAVIERVRNPVAVARAVMDTPHRLLAGEGATRFAHRIGHAEVVPTCAEARAKYTRRIASLLAGRAGGGYDEFDWRRFWNYAAEPPRTDPSGPWRTAAPDSGVGDTVGTVTRDRDGHFAATLSTGGTSITLYGRVGDVPVFGCGCFAGPAGAVACTGFGEEIIRRTMARMVYEFMAAGLSAREAVQRGCALFGDAHSLGLIAVGQKGWGVAANRAMAYGQAGD